MGSKQCPGRLAVRSDGTRIGGDEDRTPQATNQCCQSSVEVSLTNSGYCSAAAPGPIQRTRSSSQTNVNGRQAQSRQNQPQATIQGTLPRCDYCGGKPARNLSCPARDKICYCHRRGHLQSVCRVALVCATASATIRHFNRPFSWNGEAQYS